MERWLLHRAHNAGLTQQSGESTADFIARVWSADDRFHEAWFVESGVPPIFEEPSEDARPHEDIEHEHITTTDGRVLCPGAIYCELSELLHGRVLPTAVSWDSRGMLEDNEWTWEMGAAVDVITSAVTLSLRQVRVAVAYMAQQSRLVEVAAAMKGALDSFSTSRDQAEHTRRVDEAIRRDFGLPPLGEGAHAYAGSTNHSSTSDGKTVQASPRGVYKELVSPTLHGLAPLFPREGLADHMTRPVSEGAAAFAATLLGERPAGRLFFDDELTTLAFAWQRARAIRVAQDALRHEAAMLGDEFDLDRLTGRGAAWVLLTETGSLLSHWVWPPEVASAVAVASSGLRSTYWLWLEDDDRAMAVLRSVLEQAARLRVWRVKPAKAAALEQRGMATPRDWLDAAGWRRLSALNRALGEFAHTRASSKWLGARALLANLQADVQPERAMYTARGAALDFVAALLAAEVVEWARMVSPGLSGAIRDLFDESGVQVADHSDPDVEATFNHVWAHRAVALGESDLFRPADERDPSRGRPRTWGPQDGRRAGSATALTNPNPFIAPTPGRFSGVERGLASGALDPPS
jgi:hypothetical protein